MEENTNIGKNLQTSSSFNALNGNVWMYDHLVALK
mgnify:CR=1 FL=1